MKGDMTWDEYMAENLRDPEYAALWAESLPRIDLAVNVCLLRLERGLSQKQLAEAAGLSQPRITDIERSDANPTLLTITRIANALGVRVERLFAGKSVVDEELVTPQAEVAAAEQTPVPRSVRKRKPRARAALVA
ncbi:MAG TPA: helix-turn-helix transcriptional regulator [Longimicrobium sp.]|jgi:transcriptional regulator with XRE-family HTH domain|uniref:helix-turn-helix domain-containing protein n=1 Tax=Longimicrobium sp. TaxID=2029185 RepID=UPI002ED7B13A